MAPNSTSTLTANYRTPKIAKGPPWASPEEVYIGADPGCGKRCQWNGIIDEVVIFDTVLSDDDVVKLGEVLKAR